jgi:CRP-like cAMP-binding protein
MAAVEAHDELYGLLANAGPTRTLAPGEVVFEKGEHGDAFYVLESGTVVLKDGDHVFEHAHAPSMFGEMSLIESKPRSLTAVADGEASVVEIPTRTFWVLVHETPYFAQLVMTVMAERLRRASGTL